MIRICDVCERIIYDGESVVVAMDSIYHDIPSTQTYAIEQPTACRGIIHQACYGPEDYRNADQT